jgi:hypothetical protein
MYKLTTRWTLINKYKSFLNQVEFTWTDCLQTELSNHIMSKCYLLNREMKTGSDPWCLVPCFVLWIISVYICSCGKVVPWKVFVVFLRNSKNVAIIYETLYNRLEGRGFDSRWSHWNFFIDTFLPAALWLWGRLSL